MADVPNIIVVTLHDTGRHLECYDPALPKTPAIQRIAEEGVVFENHFTTCPLCSPARASIQTGRYPHSNGMNGLTHRGFSLHAGEKCLPAWFNEIGYHTALYGLQHEAGEDPARLGYAEIRTRPDYPTHCEELMPHVIAFLERRHERPFLLSVGFTEAHRPYKSHGNQPADPARVKVPPYLTDCQEVREDLGDFYGLVQTVDRGMARLLDALHRAGLSDKTLLLFTTDHGAAFPRAKSTLYDPGIGVTLLARWPRQIQGGRRVRQLTSHVDLLPTLLEAAVAPTPPVVQGRSFLGLLRSGSGGRSEVFAEKSWHGNEYDPMRGIRTERFKYIRNFAPGFLYQMPLDIKASLSGKVMEPTRRVPRPAEELYDLHADPNEVRNLAGKPDFADVQLDLSARLARWMTETGDPLPEHPIPWPLPGREHFLNNMDAPAPEAVK